MQNTVRDPDIHAALSKVPMVTLGFWIINILATTLGETGGDAVTMTWLGETTSNANPNGYLIGSAIFFTVLLALVTIQILAKRFHPFLYWATIIASTTAGTTLADFCTRSLGIGYLGGSSILLTLVILSLAIWYASERSISVDTVNTPRVETFYWTTITFSQTLGTARGDWMAAGPSDPAATTGSLDLGYGGEALVFAAARPSISGRIFRERCYSGPRSFSRGRLVPRSVISYKSAQPCRFGSQPSCGVDCARRRNLSPNTY